MSEAFCLGLATASKAFFPRFFRYQRLLAGRVSASIAHCSQRCKALGGSAFAAYSDEKASFRSRTLAQSACFQISWHLVMKQTAGIGHQSVSMNDGWHSCNG